MWTADPGCYEYHLHCRYRNPLFPAHRTEIVEAEVMEAQERDSGERMQFCKEVHALVIEMWERLRDGDVRISDSLHFLERVSELIERAGQIGGDLSDEKRILTKLMNALNHDLEGFSKGEGEEAVEHYSELHESVRNGARLFLNPFIAQMMREQSPILLEDVLPRLLSENIELSGLRCPF